MNIFQIKSLFYTTNQIQCLTSLLCTFLLICIGATIGSFSTVVSSRYGTGRTPWNPKWSHCAGCATKLNLIQNIPIIGWVLQKGHCFHCNSKISASYVIIEIIHTIVWMILLFKLEFLYQGLGLALIASTIITIIQIKFKKNIWKNYENTNIPMPVDTTDH